MVNFFLLLNTIFIFSTSFAQNDPGLLEAEKDLIYYSADIINADLLTETATLKGNVKILFDEYELNASNAFISKKDSTLKAWGDVRLEGNNSYIEADEVDLNYKTQKGDIKNVRLTSGQLLLEAKTLKKISNEVYEAEKANFTTCMTCPPSWRIKGKKIKTNINKYVDIRGGRFQILRQTIFPLPRLVLPLNTRRKTGLLPPAIENASGNSDLGISQPFFWAIDPHRDITFTPIFYLEDILYRKDIAVTGLKLLTEYNQWLGSKSRLHLKTSFMYDDAFLDIDGNSDPSARWFLHYNNFFVLPRNVIQKSQFTLLKERGYLNDFTSEVAGRGEPALKNIFSVSKIKGNRFVSAKAVYYINLLVKDPAISDNFSVHKLPELNYAITETPILKNLFLFNANATYTNFHRNSRSFDEINVAQDPDDPESEIKKIETDDVNGTFNTEEDLIRTGHRLRLNAEISAPFRIGDYFDVRPALAYKDSYYHFNVNKGSTINNDEFNPYDQFAFSRYLEFSNSVRTEFSNVYFGQIKHKIIPEIIYRAGSPINQSENIFFNSGESDVKETVGIPYHRRFQPITDDDFNNFQHGVQFDYWDRFFRADALEFSLTNIIIKKHRQELVTYYDQPFFFNLRQSYDFRNKKLFGDKSDPWSNLDGVLKFSSKHFTNHTQASYFYKAKKTLITTSNKFIYKPGRYIKIDYSDFLAVEPDGSLVENSKTQTLSPGFGWEFPTLKLSGAISYSLITEKLQGWNANFSYTPVGNCWGFGLRLWQFTDDPNPNTKDKVFWKLSFNFQFGPGPGARKSLLTI